MFVLSKISEENPMVIRNGEAEGAVSESHLIFSSRRRSVLSKVQRAAVSSHGVIEETLGVAQQV